MEEIFLKKIFHVSGEISTCQTEEFRCSTGLCIPLAWQCDGEVDCPGEDGKVGKNFYIFPVIDD